MRRAGKQRKTGYGHILLVVIIAVACYIGISLYFGRHFLPGTELGSMNVSGQSPETVKVHLTNRAAHYKLTLKERHAGNEVIMGDEIGLKAEIGGKLEQAVQSQNGWFWPAACFHRTHLQLDLASFSEDKLNQVLQHLHVTDPSRMKASKNAGVSLKRTSGEYTVTKEYYGTELRPAAFKQLVRHALSELSSSVDLDGGGAYRDPDYTSELDAVKKAAKTMNRMTDFSVTYQMTGIEPVKVDRDQIRKWLADQIGRASCRERV